MSRTGLYRPDDIRDACGFGLIANVAGKPSHEILVRALRALNSMTHRGGVGGDANTGDGCGVLMSKPDSFLRGEAKRLFGTELTHAYAVGSVFLNPDPQLAAAARSELETEIRAQGMRVVGWREVPTRPEVLGEMGRATMPRIEQCFINAGRMPSNRMRACLYMARRRAEERLENDPHFYVASLRRRAVLYKAMATPAQLPRLYPDLTNPELQTSICVFHQRFATNTMPDWQLAQPFRLLAHNGEINTIQGNRLWAKARHHSVHSELLPKLAELAGPLQEGKSDSASMDEMLDLLQAGGMDFLRAVRLMIPPAWQNTNTFSGDIRAMLEYMSFQMEPWDGPAGLVMTDGRFAVCALDRNGLRPARYVLDKSGIIAVASEIGVMDTPADVAQKGRLGPGEMLAVDTRHGQLLHTDEIDRRLAARKPYRNWLKTQAIRLESSDLRSQDSFQPVDDDLYNRACRTFGLTHEEITQMIRPMTERGVEGTGSMGDDTPQPVLSLLRRPLYDYFRQHFAQVTNPPIDSLRESIAMSLETPLGASHNIFDETPEHARRVILRTPILSPSKRKALKELEDLRGRRLHLAFRPEESLRQGLERLGAQAEEAARDGCDLIILREGDPKPDGIPIHALLGVGACHHHLVRQRLRGSCSILVETATARDTHQIATLLGFGADAIYPWLAYEVIYRLAQQHVIGGGSTRAFNNYGKAMSKGLLKIMSKMGISSVLSYRGAQLFEVVGLHPEVTDLCFTGSECRIRGATFADLEEDARGAWAERGRTGPLDIGGILKHVEGGEYHCFNPDVVHRLQEAVRTGEWQDWKSYADLTNDRPAAHLRDFLRLRPGGGALDLAQVEAAEEITPRFDSAGMSLGALSPEAHEDLARAMNSLGARSNSGEGGEDPDRFGTDRNSGIKQVASGRFGVTPHYLRSAEVLQIKIAQGAKPGEGGQLPGKKINTLIARLRHSVPGVTLISPPPHHDIYSIEDLAQLIWDLRQVNPQAMVSVKLVASTGVGTIAAGVAKAGADLITISGYDGGTAASPLTSIRYAGGPWELGIAEAQQALRANGLRGRVRLQADGGMKTGLDVVKAAILGADSVGFGTAPMVALGCKYLRICHLNNCATGVATQDKRLREHHYHGTYHQARNFFLLLAEEVRTWLAQLGVRTLGEIIGHTELLESVAEAQGATSRQRHLDLAPLLAQPAAAEGEPRRYTGHLPRPQDSTLTQRMLEAGAKALETGQGGGRYQFAIRNSDRTTGARLSGEIAAKWGSQGLRGKSVHFLFKGTAGQSFGAFNAHGVHLELEGDCNDYVGKGMAGGTLVVRPPRGSELPSNTTPVLGNTCLYGATAGELFAAGKAGERFGVRNSGALAVIEGAGEHCCEYMTGGQIVVAGQVGNNFGAGMTGGMAYVLDMEQNFVDCCNQEMTAMHRITTEETEEHRLNLRSLLQRHRELTQSAWTAKLVDDFDNYVRRFWLVLPRAVTLESLLENFRRDAA